MVPPPATGHKVPRYEAARGQRKFTLIFIDTPGLAPSLRLTPRRGQWRFRRGARTGGRPD